MRSSKKPKSIYNSYCVFGALTFINVIKVSSVFTLTKSFLTSSDKCTLGISTLRSLRKSKKISSIIWRVRKWIYTVTIPESRIMIFLTFVYTMCFLEQYNLRFILFKLYIKIISFIWVQLSYICIYLYYIMITLHKLYYTLITSKPW